MSNINPDTGVRYGVVALQSLDPDLADRLMYGPQASNLSYDQAYEEARDKAETSAAERAAELGFVHGSRDWDDYVEDQVDLALDEFSDTYQSSEDVYAGVLNGITYRISWLGGAPFLWALQSPEIVGVRSLCSPCIPNAGDLDSGLDPQGYPCYGLPADWYAAPVEQLSLNLEIAHG